MIAVPETTPHPTDREPVPALRLITLAMSVRIDAHRERVWRALTVPSELVSWNEQLLSAIDKPDAYPSVGHALRWSYLLGSVQVVMHERPIEIVPPERLCTTLRVGSLRFEQTFTLRCEASELPRTRLGMKLVTANSVPVVDDVLDRFDVRKLAADSIDRSLRSVQRWCQEHP